MSAGTALVTSRIALRVRGEHEVAVPPLDTPDLAQLPALENLTRYAAIALFVQRAREVNPTFELTPALAPIIAAICARLDGIPLALELAAARIKLLTPKALLARLDGSLALLTMEPPTCPNASRRCAARSNGATTCSVNLSNACFAGSPSSLMAGH